MVAVKPNMHLHAHLKECILDYGPLYGFWAFSFERYNGLLGNFHTNNKNPDVQIIRKFLTCSFVDSIQPPQEFAEHFAPLLPHHIDEFYSMEGCKQLYFASTSEMG